MKTPKAKTLTAKLRGNLGGLWGSWRDGCCLFGLILMGRQAVAMKTRRDFGEPVERGPKSKEKRASLKVASQVMKKAVMPERMAVERKRGRATKREKIGRRERSLNLPLGILETMK